MRPKLAPEARGYGADHKRMKAAVAPAVRSGSVRCVRCGELIGPGEPWDLGHTDDRSAWSGPEHARCNRSAGARVGNRRRSEHRDPPPPPGW